jgi:hypothetical protein
VTTGQQVVLDGRSSTGVAPLRCTWSFENQDGSIVWETADGCRITKTFSNADTKYVALKVTGANGATDVNRQSFAVRQGGGLNSGQLTLASTTSAPHGLVSFYRFDAAAGGLAADASGAGRDAVLHGAKLTSTARSGKALACNGRTSVAVPSVALRGAATLEAWVRPTKRGAWQTVVQQGRGSKASYRLFASNAGGRSAAQVGRVALTGPKLALRKWSHLALTYDGDTARLYVNGRLVKSKRASAPSGRGGLTIASGDRRHSFFGQIDDVGVAAKALTAAELRGTMSGQL